VSLVRGQGASPGQARGPITTSPESAVALADKGTPAILVRIEASAEDMDGIRACAALVTTRGGLTGDGAIAARALGKPCIAGVPSMRVEYSKREILVKTDAGDETWREGDHLEVDASRGTIVRT
jgi:pyruvate,orthophosphate dikinase